MIPQNDIGGTKNLCKLPHISRGDSSDKNIINDVTDVKWNNEGTLFVTIANDGLARLWNDKGEVVNFFKGHNGILFSAKWNKQGTAIVTGGQDKDAILWDTNSGE